MLRYLGTLPFPNTVCHAKSDNYTRGIEQKASVCMHAASAEPVKHEKKEEMRFAFFLF